jgi:hypothetical protein
MVSFKRSDPGLSAIFAVVILLALGSCGGGSGQEYFFSINVVNDTDDTITVRYDWEQVFLFYQWMGEETIPPNVSKIIDWSNEYWNSDRIEVEYKGRKKLYTVSQLETLHVSVQDFP